MDAARSEFAALMIGDRFFLAIGGAGEEGPISAVSAYDIESGEWIAAGSLDEPRSRDSAAVSDTGQIATAGGFGAEGGLISAEIADSE
jgi:hypothetical protein